MKKCVCQKTTIKFLIILNLIFGSFPTNRLAAQEVLTESAFALPFRQCWSYPTKVTTHNNIASDNNIKIIFSTLEGKLLALDPNTGIKLWETKLGGEVASDLIEDEDKRNIFVVTNSFSERSERNVNVKSNENNPLVFSYNRNSYSTSKITSLSKTTGITIWQTSLSTAALDSNNKTSVFVNNHKIITVDQGGTITTLNEIDGEILWKKSQNLELSKVVFDLQSENLAVLSKKRAILVDLETGERIFAKELGSILTSVSLFDKTTLALGNKKGEIFAIDTKTKKNIWKFRSGAEISNIIYTPKGLLVTSFDNFIYLITPDNGRVIWKRRLEGRLIIEPFFIDNNVILMPLGSLRATILDLDDGKPINQIYLSDGNYFIGRPDLNNGIITFPTANGILAFTNSVNRCISG